MEVGPEKKEQQIAKGKRGQLKKRQDESPVKVVDRKLIRDSVASHMESTKSSNSPSQLVPTIHLHNPTNNNKKPPPKMIVLIDPIKHSNKSGLSQIEPYQRKKALQSSTTKTTSSSEFLDESQMTVDERKSVSKSGAILLKEKSSGIVSNVPVHPTKLHPPITETLILLPTLLLVENQDTTRNFNVWSNLGAQKMETDAEKTKDQIPSSKTAQNTGIQEKTQMPREKKVDKLMQSERSSDMNLANPSTGVQFFNKVTNENMKINTGIEQPREVNSSLESKIELI